MRRLELIVVLTLLAGCATKGEGLTLVAPAAGESIKSDYSDSRVNLGLAQTYLEQGQLEKASERAAAALAADPHSAEAHVLLGMIHARKGEFDKASREYDRALKIAPTDGTILNAHAAWLCGRGQAEQADAEFTRALEDPKYRNPPQALANAGKCAHGTAQWAKAETYFRRALTLAPQDPGILLLLSDTELRQNKLMEARAFIQRRDSLGSDADTLDLAARIEDASGNQLGAARYRKRLQDEFPNHVPTGEGVRQP